MLNIPQKSSSRIPHKSCTTETSYGMGFNLDVTHEICDICKSITFTKVRGAKQGVYWGVSTPSEFWMGGLNTCQPP